MDMSNIADERGRDFVNNTSAKNLFAYTGCKHEIESPIKKRMTPCKS